MKKNGPQPDDRTYSTMISALDKAGRCDDALDILVAMKRCGVKPNIVLPKFKRFFSRVIQTLKAKIWLVCKHFSKMMHIIK
jgi:pentatricopeptide repeat protein